MLYYSTKLHKFYKTEEELKTAEQDEFAEDYVRYDKALKDEIFDLCDDLIRKHTITIAAADYTKYEFMGMENNVINYVLCINPDSILDNFVGNY